MEPTSSSITGAVLYGAGTFVLAATGVETQALVAATVGATIGVSYASPTGKMRAVLVFAAVVLACATAGTFAANMWMGGSTIGRNFVSTATGIVFHPLIASMITQLPAWFETLRSAIASKLGANKEPPQ